MKNAFYFTSTLPSPIPNKEKKFFNFYPNKIFRNLRGGKGQKLFKLLS